MHPLRAALSWPARTLDALGMYRVVTLALVGLVIVSFVFGALGVVVYSVVEQGISLVTVVVVALLVNLASAKVFAVKPNHESALITALILFFLFAPGYELIDHQYIAVAAAVAMVSKYILAYRRQHIFNPAAVGAVALSLTGWHEAWWWIGSPQFFIPLLLAGVAVVGKVRRWPMVLVCVVAGLAIFALETPALTGSALQTEIMAGPLLFLAFFMLTEPFTMPPQQQYRLAYGGLVGALVGTHIFSSLFHFTLTPELALVIGNALFWPTTLRQKLHLSLIEKRPLAANTYAFIFHKPEGMRFQPGQYLEWMLPHQSDSRGPRRYFTIASAPEEEQVQLALRVVDEKGSSYKQALCALEPGEQIIASQLAGDFLLPADPDQKIAMVAGGIGVTPFRSHIGHLLATNAARDIALFYCNRRESDIAYSDVFAKAEAQFGLRTVHVLSDEEKDGYETGFMRAELIQTHTPDFKERIWYISGPPVMVNACTATLKQLGVPRRQIVTDFFPGLA